jgi:hypothetical protein
MTFLELANRLLLESDISGSGLVTTANQKGEYRQAVEYINTAYQDIQSLHPHWNFLRKDLEFNTISGVSNYLETSIGLTDLGEWKLDSMRVFLTSSGIANEVYLTPCDWDDFRELFLFGSTRLQTGMPTHIAQKPDNSLILFPIPNDTYTLTGEYFRSPFVFSADADKPVFPSRYHMVIVWRALMYFATQLNAQELYAIANAEYRRLLFKLEQHDLPYHEIAGALA